MCRNLLFSLALALTAIGCADEIGDKCQSALDCSQQGSRLCDRTQPKGYCTIRGCERSTCPEEAVCVKFRPQQERLAVTYCMLQCQDSSDCRDDEGYHCTYANQLGSGLDAVVLDGANKKFCSATPREPISLPDGGDAAPDAAAADASSSVDAASSSVDAGSADASSADASLALSLPDGG